MATTIWATPDGGTSNPQDGSSYANAYTFKNAVGRVNSETIDTDWFVNLVGNFVLTSKMQAAQLTSNGSQGGRVNWRGTDSSGSAATCSFSPDTADGATYAFSASGVLKYHTFRNIDTHRFQLGDYSGFDFRFGTVGVHLFRCRAANCRRGFDFGSEVLLEGDATLVQCGTLRGATSYYGSLSSDIDCIECTSTDAAAGNFHRGGAAVRCISENGLPNPGIGFQDYGSVVESTTDGNVEGVRYTRSEMGYFIGMLTARCAGYAVTYGNTDSTLSVSGTLWRGAVNDSAIGRTFSFGNDGLQYDFDSVGDFTQDPFIDFANGDFGLNNDADGGGVPRNSGGYSVHGIDNMTYQDCGAVQSECIMAPADAVFTGSVMNRSVH